MARLATLTQQHQQAQMQMGAIDNQHRLLLDYEQRINKSLYEEIDRLEAIRQSRQGEPSIGSFVGDG